MTKYRQHVYGTITPLKLDELTFGQRQQIYSALIKSGLTPLLTFSNWEQGKNDINKILEASSPARFLDALIFKLHNLLQNEAIAALDLNGELMVSLSGKSQLQCRITVQKGKVSYQKGVISWEEEKLVSV